MCHFYNGSVLDQQKDVSSLSSFIDGTCLPATQQRECDTHLVQKIKTRLLVDQEQTLSLNYVQSVKSIHQYFRFYEKDLSISCF